MHRDGLLARTQPRQGDVNLLDITIRTDFHYGFDFDIRILTDGQKVASSTLNGETPLSSAIHQRTSDELSLKVEFCESLLHRLTLLVSDSDMDSNRLAHILSGGPHRDAATRRHCNGANHH